jgi:type II secretory pathway pseudopilin PulG
MKKSENKTTFVIICIAILIAVYGISFSIYQIRVSRAQAAEAKILKKMQDDRALARANSEQEIYVPVRTNRQRNNPTDSFASARNARTNQGIQNMPSQNRTRGFTGRRISAQNNNDSADTGEDSSTYDAQDAFYGTDQGFAGPGFGGPGFGGPGGFGNFGGPGGYPDFGQFDDTGAFDDQGAVEEPGAFVQQDNSDEVNYDNQNDFGGMPDDGDAGLEE